MKKTILDSLEKRIKGDLLTDDLHKIIYATDASVYRELPIGVVYPKDEKDMQEIVSYASDARISLIPRAGGTSLAGQCVGSGLVMDVSKYMNKIISINPLKKEVRIQPGVIRDELNKALRPYGLFFGPNTSTANRAMIGGMVGNNSCGSTSIVYGNTRRYVKRLRGVLDDGSICEVSSDGKDEIQNSRLDVIKRELLALVSSEQLINEISTHFPKASIRRRNTGYALDEMIGLDASQLDLCKLLTGSEGTLMMTSEIVLEVVDLPPSKEVLIALHFTSVDNCMKAVPHVMEHAPFACEMMDKTILDCTKGQRLYEKDRYFLDGDPEAVLLVSFVAESEEEAHKSVSEMISNPDVNEWSYAMPIIEKDVDRIWNLRKAGLGLLANLPGDKKAVACIEDTAVDIRDLSSYIQEFAELMSRFGQKSVYYAHAGDGEIHLRPILDLKTKSGREEFYQISLASARLVKKYRGSLSGEHGDGRVRAAFIREVYGDHIYNAFEKVKTIFDPLDIFNPGKIVRAEPMNESLRYDEKHVEHSYDTIFDFSDLGGVLRAAEKCNGSGDCRKLPLSGGTMCPSYMATRNEKDTTRARANTLREILTRPNTDNAWDRNELKEVMDLCLSCKGCSSECPSNIDMSAMKAEFLYQYQKVNGTPFRSRLFANFAAISAWSSKVSGISNVLLGNNAIGQLMKRVIGVHPQRSIPKVKSKRLESILRTEPKTTGTNGDLYLFIDEFTNYNDVNVGLTAVRLLHRLGYNVRTVSHAESGRAALSKGVLGKARNVAEKNVSIFKELISEKTPLIGVEPSAILSFRDEYPRIVNEKMRSDAFKIGKYSFTIEEFLYNEVMKGVISKEKFDKKQRRIKLHGHCHQKSLSDISMVAHILGFPNGHDVEIIPSGCCGMAGSFGYEKEHYEVSMKIGELVLFPFVRKSGEEDIIAASGTSCRHQIWDGTKRKSYHPIEILYQALREGDSGNRL